MLGGGLRRTRRSNSRRHNVEGSKNKGKKKLYIIFIKLKNQIEFVFKLKIEENIEIGSATNYLHPL